MCGARLARPVRGRHPAGCAGTPGRPGRRGQGPDGIAPRQGSAPARRPCPTRGVDELHLVLHGGSLTEARIEFHRSTQRTCRDAVGRGRAVGPALTASQGIGSAPASTSSTRGRGRLSLRMSTSPGTTGENRRWPSLDAAVTPGPVGVPRTEDVRASSKRRGTSAPCGSLGLSTHTEVRAWPHWQAPKGRVAHADHLMLTPDVGAPESSPSVESPASATHSSAQRRARAGTQATSTARSPRLGPQCACLAQGSRLVPGRQAARRAEGGRSFRAGSGDFQAPEWLIRGAAPVPTRASRTPTQ